MSPYRFQHVPLCEKEDVGARELEGTPATVGAKEQANRWYRTRLNTLNYMLGSTLPSKSEGVMHNEFRSTPICVHAPMDSGMRVFVHGIVRATEYATVT
ncbi:hypothetical protein, partial [Streptomyces sp. NPDC050988]|uniref:hypothetical protein n=1 Tax=Streptomyces sp. NPDC050988 TaxID=3365637 RepID=UPI0037887A25